MPQRKPKDEVEIVIAGRTVVLPRKGILTLGGEVFMHWEVQKAQSKEAKRR